MKPLLVAIARSVAVALLAFVMVAALLALIPTDPYRSSDGTGPDARSRDSSVGQRFAENLATVVRWEFGTTYAEGAPIWTLVGYKASRSSWLVLGALGIWFLLGLPIAILAGWSGGAADRLAGVLNLVSGTPTLITALLLSAAGLWVIDEPVTGFALREGGTAAAVAYLFPTVALALGDSRMADFMSTVSGRTRRIREIRFVEALRARKSPVWPHLALGLAGPVTTSLAGNLSYLLGGAIVVEFVFNLSGLAQAVYQGIAGSVVEVELVIAISLVFISVVLVGRILAEVVAWASDPRLRQPVGM
ncbi:MAG: ABC transporter permease subunit [Rhodothermales bacterium]|nr:ABC transporter permease subunit [Rhodothermales bacterium]MBO6780995.1 ABC transporter permease subunit [Rhodothermales bacterium]